MKTKLMEELSEILETSVLSENDKLADFECWDSLTALSIIALASENYSVIISNSDLSKINTVKDLVETIINTK
jgi:acyl carrier protein